MPASPPNLVGAGIGAKVHGRERADQRHRVPSCGTDRPTWRNWQRTRLVIERLRVQVPPSAPFPTFSLPAKRANRTAHRTVQRRSTAVRSSVQASPRRRSASRVCSEETWASRADRHPSRQRLHPRQGLLDAAARTVARAPVGGSTANGMPRYTPDAYRPPSPPATRAIMRKRCLLRLPGAQPVGRPRVCVRPMTGHSARKLIRR